MPTNVFGLDSQGMKEEIGTMLPGMSWVFEDVLDEQQVPRHLLVACLSNDEETVLRFVEPIVEPAPEEGHESQYTVVEKIRDLKDTHTIDLPLLSQYAGFVGLHVQHQSLIKL